MSDSELEIMELTGKVAILARNLPASIPQQGNDCEDVYRHLRAIQNIVLARPQLAQYFQQHKEQCKISPNGLAM